MLISLLVQGYNPVEDNSIGYKLIELFADDRFYKFTGISAFASQSGVQGVAKYIQQAEHLEDITIITGIDQKATSKEALQALLELEVDSFVFYQPAHTIFHPKIYLFEGDKISALIIGSSNLTASGLFSNVESSLYVEMENSSEQDYEVINQLKEYFFGLFDYSDPNLERISQELIEQLVNAGIVPTEAERRILQAKVTSTNKEPEKGEHLVSKIFPKRTLAKIPAEFRGAKKIKAKAVVALPAGNNAVTTLGTLVWSRANLPSSSVQGGGAGTNPTGGLRLGSVDRNYFVFNTAAAKQTRL